MHRPPSAPQVLWSDIEFTRREDGSRVVLGVGSCGIVFRASLRGEPVAVKCVSTPSRDTIRALLAEARTAWAARAAGVAGALGFALDGDGAGGANAAAVVLELVEGGTSLDAWARGGCATPSICARMRALADVAAVLRTLHARGLAHGDLSASNVLVDERANVRVIDFGSAHACGSAGFDQSGIANRGSSLTTPAYRDPLTRGGGAGGAVGDIFSFSILAWETLCLCDAWSAVPGGDAASLCAHIARGGRPDVRTLPRGVGADVRTAIESGWSPRTQERPTAAALATIFADAVDALAAHDASTRGALRALDCNALGGDDGDANEGGGSSGAACYGVAETTDAGGITVGSDVFLETDSPARGSPVCGAWATQRQQRHSGDDENSCSTSQSTLSAPTPTRALSYTETGSAIRGAPCARSAAHDACDRSIQDRLLQRSSQLPDELQPPPLSPAQPPLPPRAPIITSPILAAHDAYATALLRALSR